MAHDGEVHMHPAGKPLLLRCDICHAYLGSADLRDRNIWSAVDRNADRRDACAGNASLAATPPEYASLTAATSAAARFWGIHLPSHHAWNVRRWRIASTCQWWMDGVLISS